MKIAVLPHIVRAAQMGDADIALTYGTFFIRFKERCHRPFPLAIFLLSLFDSFSIISNDLFVKHFKQAKVAFCIGQWSWVQDEVSITAHGLSISGEFVSGSLYR
jgi:hypothetical protein